ncbi:MAG: ribosome biogenesis GTPase Der [Thermoflavifilum sp.]|nr:ribosome biogenesis GTPase Der [Thermoflavifilum sp.]
MAGFTIAIVGRPNVGKSTLFNRLIAERQAIVADVSGVTRDRIYGTSDWDGKTFNVVDTGGFVPDARDEITRAIAHQVEIAIDEADGILFVCDATTGITDLDDAIARMLRKSKKPVWLVVNKADNYERTLDAQVFYRLGIEPLFPISAISGSGTGELLDAIVANIPPSSSEQEASSADSLPRIAIVGQPNVGKSSLLNALIGEPRNVVSHEPGTTRDAIHTHYNLFQKSCILIDTAGIRRKDAYKDQLEFYATIRTIKAVDEADVCMLLLDATRPMTAQDVNIFSLIIRKRKGVVLLVNKWDAVEKDTHTAKVFETAIREKISPFTDVPIIFISALEKTRIYKAMETALDVHHRRKQKIPTSQLNEVLLPIIAQTPPPAVRGHHIHIKYITQLPASHPTFLFFTNYPDEIRQPYKQFLENQLRKHFAFSGVPLSIYFRKK